MGSIKPAVYKMCNLYKKQTTTLAVLAVHQGRNPKFISGRGCFSRILSISFLSSSPFFPFPSFPLEVAPEIQLTDLKNRC